MKRGGTGAVARRTLPRLVLLLVAVAMASAMSSCSAFEQPPPPTTANISGTWVNGSARIQLNRNGTFAMFNVPAYTYFGENWRDGDAPTRGADGQWSIEPDAVILQISTRDQKLFFDNNGPERLLEFALQAGSDDPRCFQFVKEGSKEVPLRPKDCFLRP